MTKAKAVLYEVAGWLTLPVGVLVLWAVVYAGILIYESFFGRIGP